LQKIFKIDFQGIFPHQAIFDHFHFLPSLRFKPAQSAPAHLSLGQKLYQGRRIDGANKSTGQIETCRFLAGEHSEIRTSGVLSL
jgi:hypothetical protein